MRRFIVFLFKFALIIAILVGFWHYQNNTIQTEVFSVASENLPEAFDGFRVAVITDLHGRSFGEDNAELIAMLAAGNDTLALLPEPHVSMATAQSENVRVALAINDLWAAKNDTQVVQGVYVVRSEFLDAHKDLVDAFLADAAASANKVVTEADAPAVVVAQGIIGKEPIAKKAIPNCNICLITGEEMRSNVSAMLKVLFDANPKSVGGAMPADDFYYVANPS